VKVALLCGGKGTRWSGDGEEAPKALARLGQRPVVWHVMEVYSRAGFTDFVLCLGHNGQQIAAYFESQAARAGEGPDEVMVEHESGQTWRVHLADTGQETQTASRLAAVSPLFEGGSFMASYGDGVAALDVGDLLRFHVAHGRLASLTAVQPRSQFGLLQISGEGTVESFIEKPRLKEWINGGFFVFEPGVVDYLDEGPLEDGPLSRLAAAGELMAYRTTRFWACLDTYKDRIELDELASKGNPPWKQMERTEIAPVGATARYS
jgi:glucose-1-phosphate cytidylyltransferase